MSHFRQLLYKETRELLRPRYVLPILFVPLFFLVLGQGFGGMEAALAEQPEIAIVDEDGGQYGDLVAETLASDAEVVHRSNGDVSAAVDAVEAEGGDAVVVIPSDFSERIESGERGVLEVHAVVDSVSFVDVASSGKVDGLVNAAGQRLTVELTGASATDLDPVGTTHTTYLKGDRIDASPGQLSSTFTQQFMFVPIVIMMVILLSGQMVMNSMGGEKENRTLETLLAMPVPRRTIVAAKLSASALVGLVAAAIMAASLYYYQSSLSFGDGATVSLSLGPLDYLVVGVAIFLALVGVLALALCLGVFAGDRQGAQMLLFPLTVFAVVPMFVTLFTDLSTMSLPLQVGLFAIPFTHPIVAPKQLLLGNWTFVAAGLVYELLFAVGAVWLAVRLFDSDRLVTGDAGRLGRYVRMLQR